MLCPFCNKEMQKGYLQSPRGIMWGPRKKLFISATKVDEFYVSDSGFLGGIANSHYCSNCKKIIVDAEDTGYVEMETVIE